MTLQDAIDRFVATRQEWRDHVRAHGSEMKSEEEINNHPLKVEYEGLWAQIKATMASRFILSVVEDRNGDVWQCYPGDDGKWSEVRKYRPQLASDIILPEQESIHGR